MMTLKQLKQTVKKLEDVASAVDNAISEMAISDDVDKGLYADLCVAQSMLDGALNALTFQADKLEVDGVPNNADIAQ